MSDQPDFEGRSDWGDDEARQEPVDDGRCAWCGWPRDQWAADASRRPTVVSNTTGQGVIENDGQ